MSISRELRDIAGQLVMVSPPLHQRLCRLAVDVAMQEAELIILREFADQAAGDACEIEQTLAQQSRSIADVIRPIVARARP